MRTAIVSNLLKRNLIRFNPMRHYYFDVWIRPTVNLFYCHFLFLSFNLQFWKLQSTLHIRWSFPLRIWSLLLKKSLMENFIFCAVFCDMWYPQICVLLYWCSDSFSKSCKKCRQKSLFLVKIQNVGTLWWPWISTLIFTLTGNNYLVDLSLYKSYP